MSWPIWKATMHGANTERRIKYLRLSIYGAIPQPSREQPVLALPFIDTKWFLLARGSVVTWLPVAGAWPWTPSLPSPGRHLAVHVVFTCTVVGVTVPEGEKTATQLKIDEMRSIPSALHDQMTSNSITLREKMHISVSRTKSILVERSFACAFMGPHTKHAITAHHHPDLQPRCLVSGK